jgi:hypothetical protein
MKPPFRYILITAALLVGFGNCGTLTAQPASEMPGDVRSAVAAPIRVVGAQIIEVTSSFMRKLDKDEESELIEVMDLGVEASSRALDAFPPSLQPILHIGRNAYPVQRVEYSNWNALDEKPIDEEAPVGDTQTFHFFIENWQELEQGQLMILSVLSQEEIVKATDGQFTTDQFRLIMPELKQEIPRFMPREFLELGKEK